MTEPTPLAGRLTAVLADAQSPLRREGVELLVDRALATPLRRLVDVDPFADVIATALAEPLWVALVERHGRGVWARLTERVDRTGEVVGDLLSAESRAHVEALVLTLRLPEAAWVGRGLDAAAIRRFAAPIVQEVLLSFSKKLPLPGVGGQGGGGEAGRVLGGIAGRIKKSVGESADRFADVGKAVMGGMEKKLAAVAKDFSHGAMSEIRDAVIARVRSAEGRAAIDDIKRGLLAELYRTPVSEILSDVESLPVADAFALVDPISRHNAGREEVRSALREELAAVLAVEAERTIGDLLSEAGLLSAVRDHAVAVLDAEARSFFDDGAITDWVGRLLTAADQAG